MPEATAPKKLKIKPIAPFPLSSAKTLPEPQKNGRHIFFITGGRKSKSCRELTKTFKTSRNVFNDFGAHHLTELKIDFVNWGCGGPDYFYGYDAKSQNRVFNKTTAVNLVRNKLKFFQKVKDAKDGPRIPTFVTSLEEAKSLVDKGEVVFGRKVTGSCGTDIATFDDNPAAFTNSDFWVVYKKKKHEFRIHLFRINKAIEIIDLQQKSLRKADPVTGEPIDTSKVNFQIRNHKNGFVFQRNDITVPGDVKSQAIKAFDLSGLDFGAVDVIWNEHEAKAYVLEINTAPGLEGTTLEKYTDAIRRMTA